ncbi:MAG: serine hydrolase, partial [Lachnospiraceae bacterium]|nr:serine hydrolase [Lachnospiraceae bacterium]
MEEKIEQVLNSYINKNEISGASILVYMDGKEWCRIDRGLADVRAGVPYSLETIIRLYSMTKPITAAAVMILIERGLLDRLDPVSDYIPSFSGQRFYDASGNKRPVSCPMTIGNLLDMTGGLSYPDNNTLAGADAGLVFDEIEKKLDTENEMTTIEVAEALGHCTLAFDPGTDYLYSTSADILGAVVEKVTGMRFSEFLSMEIFEPLDMSDTAFYVPKSMQSRLARSYVPVSHLHELPDNEKPCSDASFPGNESLRIDGSLPEYLGNNLGIKNRMETPPAFESGGAGLASTLDDYMKFAQMLLNGGSTHDGYQILSPATVDFMTARKPSPGVEKGFCKMFDLTGFTYGNLLRIACEPGVCDTLMIPGEYGWDGWLGPYFANIPSKNATILIAMQRTNSGTFALTRRL